MRRRILPVAILVAAFFTAFAPRPASATPVRVDVSIGYFHDTLAPYGSWVETDAYGECWRPSRISRNWDPYYEGEWVWTDYGWTWVSDDPWGDIPYHYGTWAWSDDYGWVWVPGTVWAPAWVTWAYTDDYVGWAPVPVSFEVTSRGYYGPPVVVSPTRYVGVNVSSVRIPQTQNAAILPRAQKTTRFDVSGGIVRESALPRTFIERATRQRIQPVGISTLKAPPTSIGTARVTAGRFAIVAPKEARGARGGRGTYGRDTSGGTYGSQPTAGGSVYRQKEPPRVVAPPNPPAPAPQPVYTEQQRGRGRGQGRENRYSPQPGTYPGQPQGQPPPQAQPQPQPREVRDRQPATAQPAPERYRGNPEHGNPHGVPPGQAVEQKQKGKAKGKNKKEKD
jgi:hypothetical protein